MRQPLQEAPLRTKRTQCCTLFGFIPTAFRQITNTAGTILRFFRRPAQTTLGRLTQAAVVIIPLALATDPWRVLNCAVIAPMYIQELLNIIRINWGHKRIVRSIYYITTALNLSLLLLGGTTYVWRNFSLTGLRDPMLIEDLAGMLSFFPLPAHLFVFGKESYTEHLMGWLEQTIRNIIQRFTQQIAILLEQPLPPQLQAFLRAMPELLEENLLEAFFAMPALKLPLAIPGLQHLLERLLDILPLELLPEFPFPHPNLHQEPPPGLQHFHELLVLHLGIPGLPQQNLPQLMP